MFETFTARGLTFGRIASLEADRMAGEFDGGADATGAADDSQSSTDGAPLEDGADPGDGGTADAEPDRRASGDADDEEFDDEQDGQALPLEEQLKRLRGANAKMKRRLGASRADRQFIKELRDKGLNPSDLYADSREFRRLMAQADRNPRLRALLYGSDDPAASADRGADRRPESREDEFTFDGSAESLGFDPQESRANATLANGLERLARLEHRIDQMLKRVPLDQLADRVNRLDQSVTSERTQAFNSKWDSVVTAAARQIKDTDLRDVFIDNLTMIKNFPQARMVQGRRVDDASFFVTHYLKKLKVAPAEAKRAAVAAEGQRQRVATNVAGLSRQNVGTHGAPAPARKQNERLADVHKRLRSIGR